MFIYVFSPRSWIVIVLKTKPAYFRVHKCINKPTFVILLGYVVMNHIMFYWLVWMFFLIHYRCLTFFTCYMSNILHSETYHTSQTLCAYDKQCSMFQNLVTPYHTNSWISKTTISLNENAISNILCTLKILCLYISTIVYILLFNHHWAVNHTTVDIWNCQN